MYVAHGVYLDLAGGMVISTLGELLVNPTVPALVTETTGQSAPFYLGVIGGFSSVGRLVGPPLFGFFFDVEGVTPILLIAVSAAPISAMCYRGHAVFASADERKRFR